MPNNSKQPCSCQTSLRNLLFQLVQCISLHFKSPYLYLLCTMVFPKFLLPLESQASFKSEEFGSHDYAPRSLSLVVYYLSSLSAHAHAKKSTVAATQALNKTTSLQPHRQKLQACRHTVDRTTSLQPHRRHTKLQACRHTGNKTASFVPHRCQNYTHGHTELELYTPYTTNKLNKQFKKLHAYCSTGLKGLNYQKQNIKCLRQDPKVKQFWMVPTST